MTVSLVKVPVPTWEQVESLGAELDFRDEECWESLSLYQMGYIHLSVVRAAERRVKAAGAAFESALQRRLEADAGARLREAALTKSLAFPTIEWDALNI